MFQIYKLYIRNENHYVSHLHYKRPFGGFRYMMFPEGIRLFPKICFSVTLRTFTLSLISSGNVLIRFIRVYNKYETKSYLSILGRLAPLFSNFRFVKIILHQDIIAGIFSSSLGTVITDSNLIA